MKKEKADIKKKGMKNTYEEEALKDTKEGEPVERVETSNERDHINSTKSRTRTNMEIIREEKKKYNQEAEQTSTHLVGFSPNIMSGLS